MQNCTLSIADRTQDGIEISTQEHGLCFPHRQDGSKKIKWNRHTPVYDFLAEESRDLRIAGSVPEKLFEHATKRIDIS